MELTAQIVTWNNAKTIQKAIESLKPLQCPILIGDLGSTDGTIDICKSANVELFHFGENYAEARNYLSRFSPTEFQIYLHPWESLVQGHQLVLRAEPAAYNVSVIQETIINKETRIWSQGAFANPAYEVLDLEADQELAVVLYSSGRSNHDHLLPIIERWKQQQPMAAEPYYYQACTALSKKNYDLFLSIMDHYLFLETKTNISVTLGRYYYALVSVQKKRVRPALQNLTVCLAAYPLMAEFWCLTGDVYYHLLNDYGKAKDFFEIAMLMGRQRSPNDRWPMDISKYQQYPEDMIKSCNQLLGI